MTITDILIVIRKIAVGMLIFLIPLAIAGGIWLLRNLFNRSYHHLNLSYMEPAPTLTQKITRDALISLLIYAEEEALTDKRGVFTISTWQNLPVTLIIEHPVYKKTKIRVADNSEHQFIKLEPKHKTDPKNINGL
jgi:hypothetical protein